MADGGGLYGDILEDEQDEPAEQRQQTAWRKTKSRTVGLRMKTNRPYELM